MHLDFLCAAVFLTCISYRFSSLSYRTPQHFITLKRDIRWLSLVITNLGAKKKKKKQQHTSWKPFVSLLHLK